MALKKVRFDEDAEGDTPVGSRIPNPRDHHKHVRDTFKAMREAWGMEYAITWRNAYVKSYAEIGKDVMP